MEREESEGVGGRCRDLKIGISKSPSIDALQVRNNIPSGFAGVQCRYIARLRPFAQSTRLGGLGYARSFPTIYLFYCMSKFTLRFLVRKMRRVWQVV